MIRGRRLAAFALACGITACASGGVYSSSPTRIADNGAQQVVRSANQSSRDSLSAPAARAFQSVRAAFAAFAVTPTLYDGNALLIGIQNQRVIRRFAGKPIRAYVDCGSSITGPRSDEWYVSFNVVSKVTARTAETSTVETLVEAFAQDPTRGGDQIPCESTGALERELAEAAAKNLATAK